MQTILQNKLTMTIQPKVIDHLGINMYTNLHAVISELIANSFDANATRVDISVPETEITEDYKIAVTDNGVGMDFDEINSKYLQVGRNRREEEASKPKEAPKRPPLGRKGIGKFAVFGVAKQVTVKSVKGALVSEFLMDIDRIKSQSKGDYEPTLFRTRQPTSEPSGVTVTLTHLKRKNKINIDQLHRGICNRFMLFSEKFQVFLNQRPITQNDVRFDDIEYTVAINESVSDSHKDWIAVGTIYGRKGTMREAEDRGIALFARGKLAQEPTFFGATSGKEYAYPHIFGRLNVDFVDDDNDVIATNRSSINWESEEGQALSVWGKKRLTEISTEFYEKHVDIRSKVFDEFPETKKLFTDLTPTEQQKARRIVNTLARDSDLTEERAKDLINYVSNVVQYASFQDLADKISEQKPEQATMIIDLFRQWQHVESREMYHILKARLSTIRKMQEFINSDAKEVPTIHNYLKQFPWLLDPRWTVVYEEAKYSKLLKEKFDDSNLPEKDRRIDFLAIGSGPALVIIELKKPSHPINVKDLDQLNDYSTFIRAHLTGNDPSYSPEDVYGFLICEKQIQTKEFDIRKKDMTKNRMYVRQYSELMSTALRIHNDFIKRYAEIKQIISDEEASQELAKGAQPHGSASR